MLFLSSASIHAENASKSSLWLPGFHAHPCSTSPTVHPPICHGWSVFSLILVTIDIPWFNPYPNRNHKNPTYHSRAHCLWRATLTLGLLATLCPSTASLQWARFQYHYLKIEQYWYTSINIHSYNISLYNIANVGIKTLITMQCSFFVNICINSSQAN